MSKKRKVAAAKKKEYMQVVISPERSTFFPEDPHESCCLVIEMPSVFLNTRNKFVSIDITFREYKQEWLSFARDFINALPPNQQFDDLWLDEFDIEFRGEKMHCIDGNTDGCPDFSKTLAIRG